jgi:hypothetical protein
LNSSIIKVPAQKFFYFSKILHRDDNLFGISLFIHDISFTDVHDKISFLYVLRLQEKAIHIKEMFYGENLAVIVKKGEGSEDWLDRIAVSREISVASQ